MIRLTLPKVRTDEQLPLFILSFLTLLLFGFGGISLLAKDAASLYSEIREGRVYHAALIEKLTALDKAEEELGQIKPKLEAIEKAVPTSVTQADLLEELFTDSVQGGLTLNAVSFQEAEKKGPITADSFALSLEGERSLLARFLEEIEKGRLILIESLAFSQSEAEEPGETTLKAKSFSYE